MAFVNIRNKTKQNAVYRAFCFINLERVRELNTLCCARRRWQALLKKMTGGYKVYV